MKFIEKIYKIYKWPRTNKNKIRFHKKISLVTFANNKHLQIDRKLVLKLSLNLFHSCRVQKNKKVWGNRKNDFFKNNIKKKKKTFVRILIKIMFIYKNFQTINNNVIRKYNSRIQIKNKII